MIAGLEASLYWGRSAGRDKDGRIPDLLRPERPGGPGPERFLSWQTVLAFSGENVPPGAVVTGKEARRYRRRIETLLAAGFGWEPGKPSKAGDTIEIRQIKGNRARGPGLMVRASPRMIEAESKARNNKTLWTRINAGRVFKEPPIE